MSEFPLNPLLKSMFSILWTRIIRNSEMMKSGEGTYVFGQVCQAFMPFPIHHFPSLALFFFGHGNLWGVRDVQRWNLNIITIEPVFYTRIRPIPRQATCWIYCQQKKHVRWQRRPTLPWRRGDTAGICCSWDWMPAKASESETRFGNDPLRVHLLTASLILRFICPLCEK